MWDVNLSSVVIVRLESLISNLSRLIERSANIFLSIVKTFMGCVLDILSVLHVLSKMIWLSTAAKYPSKDIFFQV